MKNLIIIALLGLLIGCGNQSKKAKEGNNQPQTITNIDSVGIAIDELNVDSVDIAIDELDKIEDYEGSLRFVHVFLKREDNNVFLTKYCSEKNINGDEYLIDEGFVKYHSDSVGVAIKTEFLSDVLLNCTCIGDTVTCYPSKGVDSMSMAKITWYSSNGSIKGLDSISITFFEDWDIEDHRNIFQSSISYFGKNYFSDFSEFDVNDIIHAITMSSGCSEELIPYMGCCLKVDSLPYTLTLWDVISINRKYPFQRCKIKNIHDERGTATMLLYENLAKSTENNMSLIYKNNKLTSIILGGSVISENPYLDLIDKVIKRDSIPLMYGN